MCSCTGARLPHPLFRPAPSPKLGPTLPPGPAPARRAIAAPAGAAARDDVPASPSSFDFLALKRELEEEEEAAVTVEARGGGGAVNEDDGKREAERSQGVTGQRRRRQMTRRSALLAKQVISMSSARSLGFVSQLWVDAASWVVALVEVRPSLLSGEAEKFLFEDIYQVGYNVTTSRRRNVGKVRGFTFDINSGAMESLELDSFGLSIVPSSLVSTYCLFVEDVLDIVSDTIVVHEDVVSRVQRLTQGILGAQSIGGRGAEIDDYGRLGRRRRANKQGKSGGRELRRKARDPEDDWDLPMDY
ncbi:hypothetical protein BS78_01G363700 [Paspalum vaginatum]|nr:hypothetical protein BS78_01G363700 [Paspalum vaginatum]